MIGKKQALYKILDPSNARDAALFALLSITELGLKSGTVLSDIFMSSDSHGSTLAAVDKAFAERITHGTISRLITVDAVIDAFSKKPSRRMRPLIRGILRISVYQLMYMDRVPHAAVCNEACILAKLHHMDGLTGFVNGILRAVSRDLESGGTRIAPLMEDPLVKYSLPGWLHALMVSEYGSASAESIFKAWLMERPNSVRFNLSRTGGSDPEAVICKSLGDDGYGITRVDIGALIDEQGLPAPEGPLPVVYEIEAGDITRSEAFKRGWITVQDVSSALAASYAAPGPGDLIMDVCAAPGGKSLAAADMVSGRCRVDARDVSPGKTRLIEESASRCGFSCITTGVYDATMPDEESFSRADILLADLPCSGLGTLSKKPDIKLKLKPYSITELGDFQRDILRNVSRYVKPRGRLVYSTCTLTGRENSMNTGFIKNELGLRLLSEALLLPGRHNDGFYIAVFEKRY